MHQWAVEREERLKEKRTALEAQERRKWQAKSVKTASRVNIHSFAARQDEHVKQKRENYTEKRAAREKKELDGMFKPAITDKSRAIIAERTANKGGETSLQRLMEPTAWSQRKAHSKNRKPMPIYKGFSMIPVRDWDGIDQWTGTPRKATSARSATRASPTSASRKNHSALKGPKSARSRTPPRAKTPARRAPGDAVAAKKAALQDAAAAHDAVRAELEVALQRVQSLSDAATTKRSGACADDCAYFARSVVCTCRST